METFDLDQKAGEHFTFRKLIECGETWLESHREGRRVPNLPVQDSSRLAMLQLATTVLDPIWNHYGPITITYGFCSPELARLISKKANPGIAPAVDQHASCEVNTSGNVICSRQGAACDFYVDGMKAQMNEVAHWVANSLRFDSIYYYGKDRPLHISVGPEMKHTVLLMSTDDSGRRKPGRRGNYDKGCGLMKEVNY